MELTFHLVHDTNWQQYWWKISEAVNTVKVLLMMDENIARNM
jgi:hypothetical protein